MLPSNFDKRLKENSFTPTEFNSNNAWGFGGAIGTRYVNGAITVTRARAFYRHLPSETFITVKVQRRTLFNEKDTGENRREAYALAANLAEAHHAP